MNWSFSFVFIYGSFLFAATAMLLLLSWIIGFLFLFHSESIPSWLCLLFRVTETLISQFNVLIQEAVPMICNYSRLFVKLCRFSVRIWQEDVHSNANNSSLKHFWVRFGIRLLLELISVIWPFPSNLNIIFNRKSTHLQISYSVDGLLADWLMLDEDENWESELIVIPTNLLWF